MARVNIDNLRALGNFATLYSWHIEFITMPKVDIRWTTNDMNIRCISTELPKMTGESINIEIRGLRIKQPGRYTPQGTFTLTFAETVDNNISTALINWRNLCWKVKTGGSEAKADLEASMRLVRMDYDEKDIWEYKLKGCFLEDYDPSGGQLEGATSDILRPQMILSYDYFEDNPLG